MKIALITYHYSCNHGAVMQTYALCRFLKSNGFDVEIINISQNESIKQPIYVKIPKYIIQGYRINKFIKNYYPPLTRTYNTLEELQDNPPVADFYIVGSDQTWNPNISKNLKFAYFLDFGHEATKRISYASSFGLKQWPTNYEQDIPHIKKLLNRFCSLSVRESEGQDLCEETFGFKPELVLDPCFLNDNYNEIVGNISNRNEIVCYKLNKTADFYQNIQYVKTILECPAVLLNENFPRKHFQYCFNPSLKQWMNRIAGAKFVVTDSFHGIVFCILFHKQFVATINNNGKDSRLFNLMRMMGLEQYLVPSLESLKFSKEWISPIDYAKVDKKKEELIASSRKFLLDSLHNK